MPAPPSAVAAIGAADVATQVPAIDWAEIAASAPQLAATMRRYLVQLAVPRDRRSVDVADR